MMPSDGIGVPAIAPLHERSPHFVDRAVSAPGDNEICARCCSFERKLVRMVRPLRQTNVPLRTQTLERAQGHVGTLGAGAPAASVRRPD